MTDDGFNKGHTNFNMFSVFGEEKKQDFKQKTVKVELLKTTTPNNCFFYAACGHKQQRNDQTVQFGHQVSKQF